MIDVIIPAYNCSATLGRTLASLVAQTDSNFNTIIVDDCSTEDIKSIIDNYINTLSITYVRNQENLGCGMSRQVGIDNSTGEFFCFLDSDDMFMPYTIEVFNTLIKKNPNTEFVHSHFYEQMNSNLGLHTSSFMYCHGKLYNRQMIEKYQIRNSPEVKWYDDFYFNSICVELLNIQGLPIPIYLWCNNQNSVIRKEDKERDKNINSDYLNAMEKSVKFILQYKDNVNYLKQSLDNLIQKQHLQKTPFTEQEYQKIIELSNYIKE